MPSRVASSAASAEALPWRAPSTYLKLTLLAVAYYLAAQVGLWFAISDSLASPVWPPAGLAIAAVALWGVRAMPGVAAGVIATEATAGIPLPWTLLVALGTTAEAAVGGLLLRRAGGAAAFGRMAGFPAYAGAILLGPLVAASFGMAALVGSGMVPWARAPVMAITWFFGDVAGAALLAPALLLFWDRAGKPVHRPTPLRMAEGAMVGAALVAAILAVFAADLSFAYVYVGPLVWIALRFGPAATAAGLVALDVAAILGSANGHGPYAFEGASRDPTWSLLLLQGFVVGLNLLCYAVAALSWERSRAALQLEQRVRDRTRELQESNDRLRHEAQERALAERQVDEAQKVARMGTWRWDITKPHAEWSPELYRIYGLDPGTHVPSYDDYLTRIHPDDVERVKAATAGVMQDHRPYSHDERIRRPDGSWRTLHTWAQAILGPDGKLVALVGACQDVTEDKQAEAALQESLERFRALADASPVGIVHTTPRGSVDYANKAWSEITGVKDFADDAAVRKAIHPEDQPRSWRLWEAAVADGTPFLDEMRWVWPDGTVRLTVCRAVPVRGAGGAITGFVSTVEDVTDQRAAEERDREVQMLKQQAEFKTNFLRTAAHELGTPLTPIVLQTRLLRTLLDARGLQQERHALDVLDRNIQRLRVLVQDLLESARLQSGRLRLNPRPTDLSHVVHEVVETFQGPAIDSGVLLDMQGPPELQVVADPDRLAQVLYNLLSNAMKFSRRGDAVHVRLSAPAAESVQIVVEDTGSGFPPERAGQLFQPFSQIHDTMQTTRGGSGLGLYISRGIVEEHGGTISAKSGGLGLGATFVIALPRVAKARAAETPSRDEAPQAPARIGPGARRPAVDVPLEPVEAVARAPAPRADGAETAKATGAASPPDGALATE